MQITDHAALRQTLKDWENEFAAGHSGQKPTKADVKQDAIIAQKYKEYNQLRNGLASAQTPLLDNVIKAPCGQNRKSLNSTPQKRCRRPSSGNHFPDHPLSPHASQHDTPQLKRTLGPTPQKNGMILGLFDGCNTETTNHQRPGEHSTPCVSVTPTKRSVPLDFENYQRSPARSGSQPGSRCSHPLITPTTKRFVHEQSPGLEKSISKLQYDLTPIYLRRDNQILHPSSMSSWSDKVQWSPSAVRKRPGSVAKGLSALVKSLRNMEDDEFDEELSVLRSMECADGDERASELDLKASANWPQAKAGIQDAIHDRSLELHVASSRAAPEEPISRWKKRGQKRTTRKSNMKPSTAKWQPEAAWTVRDDEADEQVVNFASKSLADKENHNDGPYTNTARTNDDIIKRTTVPAIIQGEKTKKRKIKATSHANFRALKIKSRNSKSGKGNMRGRFGR